MNKRYSYKKFSECYVVLDLYKSIIPGGPWHQVVCRCASRDNAKLIRDALNIKEARPTVRAKRLVQQPQPESVTHRTCAGCAGNVPNSCHCGNHSELRRMLDMGRETCIHCGRQLSGECLRTL